MINFSEYFLCAPMFSSFEAEKSSNIRCVPWNCEVFLNADPYSQWHVIYSSLSARFVKEVSLDFWILKRWYLLLSKTLGHSNPESRAVQKNEGQMIMKKVGSVPEYSQSRLVHDDISHQRSNQINDMNETLIEAASSPFKVEMFATHGKSRILSYCTSTSSTHYKEFNLKL